MTVMMMMMMTMVMMMMMMKPKSGLGRFIVDVPRSHSGTHTPGRTPLNE